MAQQNQLQVMDSADLDFLHRVWEFCVSLHFGGYIWNKIDEFL